jgi:hypothetical protein
MAIDPKDVGELQKALNDAAGKASVLWTTFIIFQPCTLMVGCRNPQRQMVTRPKGQQFQWLSSGESSPGSKPE